jgi:hypothetical protein
MGLVDFTPRRRSAARSRSMIRNRNFRRPLALVLIAAGGLLMWLSTSVGPGLVAFGLGVLLEVVGLALEHRGPG